jgi:hypothetical protein
MIERNKKLPQSRYYLRAATYGIKVLVGRKPMDEGFLFFSVGILASLRAVQHALLNHDSTLSPLHKAVRGPTCPRDRLPNVSLSAPAGIEHLRHASFT